MLKRIYIVTGANGFLGNNVVRRLLQEEQNEVRALVLPDDELNSLNGLNCKIYYGDVTNKETLKEIFTINEKAEVYVILIHCAAIVFIKSKHDSKMYEVNFGGTKNIIDNVLKINAKLVYVSSVHAIEEKENNEVITETTDFNPDNVEGMYAKTKAETAKYFF